MFCFGYIVTQVRYRGLPEDLVSVVGSIGECKDPSLPKLIVGLKEAKQYATDNGFSFKILDNKFPDGNMWTFGKTDKREFYERDMKLFMDYVVRRICSSVKYNFVDIFRLKYSKAKKMYEIIISDGLNKRRSIIYIDKGMAYMPLKDGVVMGFSIDDLEYIGADREEIITKMRASNYLRVMFSTNKEVWKIREIFSGKEYVIPYIFENFQNFPS